MHVLLLSTALKMHLLLQVVYWKGLPSCTEALSAIQWDPPVSQCLWDCQRMQVCWYTLYWSAELLGQNRRSSDALTAWICSFCQLVTASLLLQLAPGVPDSAALQHGCADNLSVLAAGG